MSIHKDVLENLGQSLQSIKVLRTNVSSVFESLMTNENVSEENKEDALQTLQALLNSVNSTLKDCESSINHITIPGASFTLSSTGYLSHETNFERQALYSELIKSYKWHEKLHNYSHNAALLIGQNALKRSFYSNSNKRRRLPASCHNASFPHINQVINAINFPNMSLKLFCQFASSAVVYVQVSRILKAAIVLKGLIIEWVSVKGFDESLESPDDHWTESKFLVFQRVQDHAHQAMLHFFSPTLPELGIRSFFTWFRSYITLFSEPCKKCKNYLFNDLPPTFRDLRTLEPYHEECKQ